MLVGHDAVVARLARAVAQGTLGHAYLVTGAEHSGKTTLAQALVQALNCAADEVPCGECSACRRIIAGTHPDVHVISLDSAADEEGSKRSEIGIKQVRDEVRHWAQLAPFEGRQRVFIINGAEMLSGEAANCLLKTLEEPQAQILFLLLTADVSRLPETVVSRCQRIDLRPVAAETIEQALLERGVEPSKARLFSRLSHGRPGQALDAASSEEFLEDRAGRLELFFEMAEGGLERRFEYSAELASRFSKKRAEVRETLDEWLELWRDLLLLKAGADESVVNLDYMERLQSMAHGFNIKEIRAAINAISQAQRHLRRNVGARLALDVMMLDIPRARAARIAAGG